MTPEPASYPFAGPLGLIIRHDPRSLADYPMETKLRGIDPLTVPVSNYWKIARVLNQGSTNACVGYAHRDNLEATPVAVPPGVGPDGWTIYTNAQKIDGINGPHEGTSLVAGAEVCRIAGLYKEYRWTRTVQDVALWVLTQGPVIMGTVWTTGMDAYDSRYVLHPTGSVRGGHAWTVYGYEQRSGYFRMVNSWGSGWAQGGKAWIWWKDLQDLLEDRAGEAMAPTEPA